MSLSNRASPTILSIVSLLALLIFMPFLFLAAYNTARIVSRATGTRAMITVDSNSDLGPIKTDFYHAFAQGGEESADMLKPITQEVASLHPLLIRIDHIYDHYNVVNRKDTLSFEFDALDAVVDSIVATGAKPVLALSYMPAAIAKDGEITNVPNDWNEWALVVQKTIEHFSGKSQRNIRDVYYEVWNEPDAQQFGGWNLSDQKNYLILYKYAAIGAQKAESVSSFFLGGPGTTGLKKDWIIALITSGNRVDFLSWHSYFPDPRRYAEDQRSVVSWLMPYPGFTLTPKLITEFGFSGAKDIRYNSSYAAAYTASVIRQLLSGGPTYLFSFQLIDGPGQQIGNGWGLLTHSDNGKRPKPRYHIFSFLDNVVGNRIDLRGEGTWVTGYATKDKNTISIALVNFSQEGDHSETVPVTVTSLTSGTYAYRERFFQGRTTARTETIQGSVFSTELYMPSHSVAIVELSKQ